MESHEAANIFPLDEATIPKLAEDIRSKGQLEPIKLFKGKILDGRRRWRACELIGVTPKTVEVLPPDPVAYVMSENLYRRQLTTSQATMCAARADKLTGKLAEEAKKRQKEAGKQHGRGKEKLPENLPEAIDKGDTRDQLGAKFGVSGKNVEKGKKILKDGIPELAAAIDAGNLSVNKGDYIAGKPKDMQRQLLEQEQKTKQTKLRKATPNEAEQDLESGKSRGIGVRYANEAVGCLKRIPKNDALRKRGFQIVTDWIRHNK